MTYTHLAKDDPSIEVFRGVFYKMRRALGTNAFGLNEVRFPPGFEGPEHDESDTGHEEVYIGLEGHGTFTIDGTVVELAEGDYLRVEPGVTRQLVAGPEGLRMLVVGAKPQPAYDGRPSL
jgi:quercetin dioxygenase-like cupin family protein